MTFIERVCVNGIAVDTIGRTISVQDGQKIARLSSNLLQYAQQEGKNNNKFLSMILAILFLMTVREFKTSASPDPIELARSVRPAWAANPWRRRQGEQSERLEG
jgi:hypothetical protein